MIYSFNNAWSDFRLGIPLSISCFPSAIIVPPFQHTSLTEFFDHNDVYLGCMECNLNDYWKLQDEELGDACTIRNVFISQGAQIRNNVTSTRNDHDYDK
uniref:Uncharacterized protein n=1 Tax=Ascaris lumbricoides TaxID=6252 RepID=A0A0M3IU12_ASCLU